MIFGTRKNQGRCAGCGFTLTELLVANAVVAIALLGVHGLFRQVVEVERSLTLRWENRGAAEAVADHLAEAMQHVVNLPGKPAILAEPSDDGARAVTCFTQAPLYRNAPLREAGVSRRRYAWRPGEDPEQPGEVDAQMLTYGGSQNLSLGAAEEGDDAAAWNQATPMVIGGRVDELAITFRAPDDANAAWQDQGSWQGGQVVVRIRVRVGGETAERVVLPRAGAMAVARNEEG